MLELLSLRINSIGVLCDKVSQKQENRFASAQGLRFSRDPEHLFHNEENKSAKFKQNYVVSHKKSV